MGRKQCHACPWKVTTDPERDIPGGYSADMHERLSCAIAEPGSLRGTGRAMACHESAPGAELECVGWVMHQLGPGNNIALRLRALDGRYRDWRTVGEQHQRFEDTLPRRGRRKRLKGRT